MIVVTAYFAVLVTAEVWHSVISCVGDCVFVFLCVNAVKRNWLELSAPNLVAYNAVHGSH